MPDLIDAQLLCLNVPPNHLRGAIRMITHRLALLAENPSTAVSRDVFPEKNSWQQALHNFIEMGIINGLEMWTEFCRLFKKLTAHVDFQILWDIFEDTDSPDELFSRKLFSQDNLMELFDRGPRSPLSLASLTLN
ncbi:788eb5a1-8145-4740-a15c-77be8bc71e87 [Sclerotinia trifoliorum]|uniref:788eb5a1-8145-4740-a15c-77be8bc71e87 n=1 Tax=Sclerotinia trifoliorum TaxID=28548 RepID=A0A8H2ZSK8_9HELO|nr:788eb5a1-8145-4740-a15c-77be8bc71e87 [Sclerotinia trifoliorum]